MYTLRFPFSLQPGREIDVTEQSSELDGLTFSLKKPDRFYVLTISGFPDEEAARCSINNVWSGLMWVLLHLGLSPDAIWEPQNIEYVENPYQAAQNLSKSIGYPFEGPVDGLIGGERPAIYLTNKQVRTITAGQPFVTLTTPAKDVIDFFKKGASFSGCEKVIDDTKLRVALDLYGAYFVEHSANARFLTLVMTLEALAIGTAKTQLVLNLLDRWKDEVDELLTTVKPESDDAVSLEALHRELFFRKDDSIRQQIRSLVTTTLKANGDNDAEKMARNALKLYDHRSKLVHDGKLESRLLSKATSDAKHIVERVLRARFVQALD